MYHNGIVGLVDLFIPHLFKDLIRAEHTSGIGGEQVQDIEFNRRQLDFFAVNDHPVIVLVDGKAADCDLVLHILPRVAVGV